jgi:hypothetical protein
MGGSFSTGDGPTIARRVPGAVGAVMGLFNQLSFHDLNLIGSCRGQPPKTIFIAC